MKRYTAGNWFAVYTPSMNLAGVHIRAKENYLQVSYCNSSDTDRPEADALLIAAAPDMFEVLDLIIKDHEMSAAPLSIETLILIQRALDKARGAKI